jgi:hypothetical protein
MEQQMEFNFESSIQGYHVYKSIWTYEISEKLRCDYFATSFKKKLNTLLSSMGMCPTHCSLFPSFRTSFTANLSFALNYHVPSTYTFSGQAADVEKLRTLLKPTAT